MFFCFTDVNESFTKTHPTFLMYTKAAVVTEGEQVLHFSCEMSMLDFSSMNSFENAVQTAAQDFPCSLQPRCVRLFMMSMLSDPSEVTLETAQSSRFLSS